MYCISAFTGGSSWVGPAASLFALFPRSLAPALERRLGPPCGGMIRSNYDGTNLDTFPRKALQSHSCAAPQERSSVSVSLPGST